MVFPPESRQPVQVPEVSQDCLPPSSSPSHRANRGQKCTWTVSGRWTQRTKSLEEGGHVQHRQWPNGKVTAGHRPTFPVMAGLSIPALLLSSCDSHPVCATSHLCWGLHAPIHWEDLFFRHHRVKPCEPREATNLKQTNKKMHSLLSKIFRNLYIFQNVWLDPGPVHKHSKNRPMHCSKGPGG